VVRMSNDYTDLIQQLHKYADAIESNESLQCTSICRRAAYVIQAEQENVKILELKLNKTEYTLRERVNMLIGLVKLKLYLLKKKYAKR
jgi:hypothetical protein